MDYYLPFQGCVGVCESPVSKTSLNSLAYFTNSLSSLRVDVIVLPSLLFDPSFWRRGGKWMIIGRLMPHCAFPNVEIINKLQNRKAYT